jgi:hypothetical protein
MNQNESASIHLARRVAAAFGALPAVEAVALGGSQAGGPVDAHSDVDLYVYTTSPIPVTDRQVIVDGLGTERPEINQTFWDVGDVWHDAASGIEVEAVYWGTEWTKAMLDRVLVHHRAGNGYSTSHWYTIRNSLCLHDKTGWFASLQERSRAPYPEGLRRAIIARNHPVLRRITPSYRNQIGKAIERNDPVSVNHRVTGLLASYFDVLFALNRVLHPGEKRLLALAAQRCARVPANMQSQVRKVIQATATGSLALMGEIDELIDALDRLLLEEGLDV